MFLYYAQAVDSTMLTALSALASEQSDPTEETMKKCKQFLDYVASQEDAVVIYKVGGGDCLLLVAGRQMTARKKWDAPDDEPNQTSLT